MYLIVSVECIGFDHTLFVILYAAIFAASMSINVQYSEVRYKRLAELGRCLAAERLCCVDL